MKKLIVTNDYLFYEKKYPLKKQIGILYPEALWDKLYREAQAEHPVGDNEHQQIANEECRANYGFYYKLD